MGEDNSRYVLFVIIVLFSSENNFGIIESCEYQQHSIVFDTNGIGGMTPCLNEKLKLF